MLQLDQCLVPNFVTNVRHYCNPVFGLRAKQLHYRIWKAFSPMHRHAMAVFIAYLFLLFSFFLLWSSKPSPLLWPRVPGFTAHSLCPGPEEPEACAGWSGARRAEMKAAQPLSAGFSRQGQPRAEGSRETLTWKVGDGSFDLDQMDFLITEYETQNLWQIPEIQTGDAEERAHRTGLKGWWGRHNCLPDGPAYSLMCGTLCHLLYSVWGNGDICCCCCC